MMVCSLRITKRMALSRYFIITFYTLRQLVYSLVFGLLYTSYRKGKKGNVCIRVKGFFGRSLSRFLQHEETRNISTSPRMRCKSIAGLHPALNLPVPICTLWLRHALLDLSVWPKSTKQCPPSGLEPNRSGVQRTNHETSEPPHRLQYLTIKYTA